MRGSWQCELHRNGEEHMFGIKKLTRVIRELVAEVRMIRRVLRLRRPGTVFVRMFSENDGMSKFKFVLPQPGANDVVSRELTYSINGGEPVMQQLTGIAMESELFDASQGDTVTGALVDIDDAQPVGWRSPESTFNFILQDTIAPSQPGAVGVQMVEE